MSIDPLDAAFIRRLAVVPRGPVPPPAPMAPPRAAAPGVSRPSRPAVRPHPAPEPEPAAETARRSADAARPPEPPARADEPRLESPPAGSPRRTRPEEDPVVERLLARAPEQWAAIAEHVEAARQHGHRVIAVAGSRAAEGRTTLVRGLAETLRGRGREVICAAPHDLAVVAGGADGRGPTHDKRIILVDAGIWFPPGPIRRAALQVVSLGCDAAILVRRAGAAGGLARQAALEAIGIAVLGEVLTFASPLDMDATIDGGAAA